MRDRLFLAGERVPAAVGAVAPAVLLAALHVVSALLWLSVGLILALHVQRTPAPWDRWESLGFLLYLAFPLVYVAGLVTDRHRGLKQLGTGLLAGEAACALGAFALMQRDPLPALLTVVAAQMAYRWSGRQLVVPLLLVNLGLYACYLRMVPAGLALAPTLLYATIEVFAVLLIRAQLRGEQARAELAGTNAALLSMQALLEETVRDRERLRIARDLHDVMGHKLTALQINLQVMQQRQNAGAAPPAELERAANLAAELLGDTRAIVRQSDEASGIAMTEALCALGEAFPPSVVEVVTDPQLRVRSGETARLLLRVAQEGVTNALRHGAARHVRVELSPGSDGYALRVIDDGQGLRGQSPGFGLTQLRARLEALGGSLELRDLPGRGVELRARVVERSGA